MERSRTRYERVVPIGMQLMSLEAELVDIFLRYLDAGFILAGIQDRFDFESAACSGAADEIDHGFEVDQRFTLPVQANEGEQSVLDLVPLAGARRIVANGDGHARFIT